MANGMSHDIPSEFTDEDRWLKIFSSKSFAVLGVTGIIMLLLTKFFGMFGIPLVGAIPGGILVVAATGVTMIRKFGDNYLKGAGQTWDRLLILRLIRWKNRVIYVKGYGKGR